MSCTRIVVGTFVYAYMSLSMTLPGKAIPMLSGPGELMKGGGSPITHVNARRAHGNVNHNVNRHHNVNRNTNVNRNVNRNANVNVNVNAGHHGGVHRGAWVGRPYRWAPGGAIAAGAAIGFVAYGAAVAWAPPPPQSGLCWYYTDATQRNGFWDSCP